MMMQQQTCPRARSAVQQLDRQRFAPSSSTRRWQRQRCAAAKVEVEQAIAQEPQPFVLKGNIARLKAQRNGTVRVVEQGRPLAEYMSLPASQYSVLDARMIERLSESTFRCYVGQLKMFGWSAEPVLTVSVTVEEGGCTIRLLSCQIKGSPQVEELNNQFTAQMVNVVRWRPCQEAGCGTDKDIVSNTTLEVCLQVPAWCSFIPARRIEDVGSSVLQQVINLMVPRFLKQLEGDYKKWANGEGRKLTN